MASMSSKPAHPKSLVFRVPASVPLWLLFGLVFILACAAIMAVMGIVVFQAFQSADRWLGLFPLICALFLASLALYCLRDLRGKWGIRIVLDSEGATLTLPSGRMLIRRPPAQRLTLSYSGIAAVETRLEAYPTLRMVMMQRAYALRRNNGEVIFLFEDRALATGFESATFSGIARELAARAGVAIKDLGMAEGRGGFAGVWGAHAPDWAAPALAPERQRELWDRAAATGTAAGIAASVVSNAWLGGIGRRRKGSEPPPF